MNRSWVFAAAAVVAQVGLDAPQQAPSIYCSLLARTPVTVSSQQDQAPTFRAASIYVQVDAYVKGGRRWC